MPGPSAGALGAASRGMTIASMRDGATRTSRTVAPSLAVAVLSDAVVPSRQVSSASAACVLLVMPSSFAVGPAFCAPIGVTQTSRKVAPHSEEAAV